MAIPLPVTPGLSHTETMRAAVYDRFGPPEVLQVRTLARPRPKTGEIRICVGATTVTAACTMMRRGDTLMARVVLGVLRPRRRFQIPGIEFAGTVDAVGPDVTDWREGDRVFGFAGMRAGPYAQYFCMPASASVAPAPPDVDDGEAASLVDGPTTALFFLKELAGVRRGERVLVIGASGSVGGAAVQVGRALGATVTGVCSGRNVELVRSLGADAVLDYTAGDFTRTDARYDVIFDAVTKSTFGRCRRCLAPGGRYLATVPRLRDYLLMGLTRLFGTKRVVCGMSVDKRASLRVVTQMLEEGSLRPVIDRRYPLDEIAVAHRYVDTGRKRGNVVIDMMDASHERHGRPPRHRVD